MSARWCSVGQYDQTNAVRSATSQSDCLDFHAAHAEGDGPSVRIGAMVRILVTNNANKPHVSIKRSAKQGNRCATILISRDVPVLRMFVGVQNRIYVDQRAVHRA